MSPAALLPRRADQVDEGTVGGAESSQSRREPRHCCRNDPGRGSPGVCCGERAGPRGKEGRQRQARPATDLTRAAITDRTAAAGYWAHCRRDETPPDSQDSKRIVFGRYLYFRQTGWDVRTDWRDYYCDRSATKDVIDTFSNAGSIQRSPSNCSSRCRGRHRRVAPGHVVAPGLVQMTSPSGP